MTKQELEQENKQLKQERDKWKCLLFLGVRNVVVLPKGLLLGKSEEDICGMVLLTIKEMEENADIELIKKLIELGEKYNEQHPKS